MCHLKQEELIKQLQEQHFEQYMNQVYQQQLLHQQQQAEQLRAMKKAQRKQEQQLLNGDHFKGLSIGDTSLDNPPNLAPPPPPTQLSPLSSSSPNVTSQNQVNVCLISENETCEKSQKEKRKSTVSVSSSPNVSNN